MNRLGVVLFCLSLVPISTRAQARPAPLHRPASTPSSAGKPPDYSREPFVIERYFTTVRFENDGTGERDIAVKARVQTEAGAQQLKQIVFAYNSANEQIAVRYVRVRGPNGKVSVAGPDVVKDLIAPIARNASAYSDCKEKQISVPALSAGDTLEYEIARRIVAPPAPGQFWFDHRFLKDSVVLDERLQVNVPASRKIILKSLPGARYETETANGRTTYRWKRSNLAHAPSDPSNKETEQQDEELPDVQLSSFSSWQDVARWYANLSSGRAASSPEILAKTHQLTESRAGEMEKIQALYDFVSKKIRYVEIPFGTGTYQPHRAADILANGYADSSDEHVLLAAMLDAAGISSDAAFISYRRKLDATLPSPAQFDHLITAVPLRGEVIWMDSTPQVAPFRLLASPLRDKFALLVPGDGNGQIAKTPANPPFVSTQDVRIDGGVDTLGKLTAHATYTLRGDTELVLRLAFHKTPEAEWTQLGQTILSLDGLQGEVSSVKPSNPLDTEDPFTLNIAFSQSNFVGWSAKTAKAELPLLAIGLPNPPAKTSQPIHIGSPLNVTVSLKLRLPADLVAQPPVGTSLTRDYAEYKSSYRYAEHAITAQRSLDFKMRELPPARASDYDAFTRAVTRDEMQPLALENTSPGTPVVPASATADELLEAGLAAFNAGDDASSIPLFERVVQIDPQHKSAWNDLGLARFRAGNYDAAVAAFQKQLEVNPADYDYLGLAYQRQRNYPDAIAAFRKQIQANPLDPVAHAALGEIFLDQHEYAAAVPELDKATILSPENVGLRLALGRAYLNVDDNPKAIAAFEAAAQLSPTPPVWNNIAYNLADRAVEFDKAQHYVESAISATEADLQKIDLSHVTPQHLSEVVNLGAYWDTLGWLYFRKGEFETAERYVRAAWVLDQTGEIADHLAQIDEQLGQKARAIHQYALALAAPGSLPDTRARLILLLGGNTQIDTLVEQARPDLALLRRIPAGKLDAEDAQADFLIVLSPGEKSARVDAIRFVGGSERLKPFSDRLRSLDYGAVFPNSAPVKIVRRGRLDCSAKTSDCTLTLIRPEDLAAAYKPAK